MKVEVSIGYDGPVKVWFDGKEIYCDPDGINPAIIDDVKLIFNSRNRQPIDCKRQSALEKRLGTTFWLLGGLGSVFGELPDGGRQSDAGGA